MKIFLILFFLIFCFKIEAEQYQINRLTDKGNNFTVSTIKIGEKVIAQFFLMNPDPFYFYAIDDNPDFFPDIEKKLNFLATLKDRGQPVAAIMADFRDQKKVPLPILNIKYMLRYLFIMSFAKPYLKQIYIMSPKKTSHLFLAEIKINSKTYFGALRVNEAITETEAKNFIFKLGLKDIPIIVAALDNIPIRFISFVDGSTVVIYESRPGHKHFSCVFLAGDKK